MNIVIEDYLGKILVPFEALCSVIKGQNFTGSFLELNDAKLFSDISGGVLFDKEICFNSSMPNITHVIDDTKWQWNFFIIKADTLNLKCIAVFNEMEDAILFATEKSKVSEAVTVQTGRGGLINHYLEGKVVDTFKIVEKYHMK